MFSKNTRKFLHYAIPATLALCLCFVYIRVAFGAEPSVGAVNNWFSLSNATTLSVDMTPNRGESGYHFYSLSPFFQSQSYGLYSGIQTNGNLGNGVDVGNIFLLSVWNATAAYPENGSTATPFGGEGVGYSLRVPYNWQVGRTYTITIRRESFDSGLNGWRWSSSITDKTTNATLKLGEILAPSSGSALQGGSAFHERYVGSTPSCTSTTSNLEAASVTFSNLASNQSAAFYGSPAPNNIFASSSCSAFIHTYNQDGRVITGFGMIQTDFDSLLPGSAPTSTPNPSPTSNTDSGTGTNSGSGSSSSGGSSSSSNSSSGSSATTGSDPSTSAAQQETPPTSSEDQNNDTAASNESTTSKTQLSKPQKESFVAQFLSSVQLLSQNWIVRITAALSILGLGVGVHLLLKHHILRI